MIFITSPDKTKIDMKKLFFLCVLACILSFSATGFAQTTTAYPINQQECGRNNWSPIQCGFYLEGHQDGASDARNNQDHDYKRYRRKFNDQYETYYRDGYDRGYSSVTPFARWTNKQKDVYRRGYEFGRDDKRREISRLPARYEGRYDRDYEAYYRRGYFDGYDGKPRTYDVPLGRRGNIRRNTNRGFPGRRNPNRFGAPNGTLSWSGRVDGRVNIIVRGNTVRTQTISGRNLGDGSKTLGTYLPRRTSTISVRKRDGRGSVAVVQQPSRINNYTTIVQISDPRRGADNYQVDISWKASNVFETYSSGRLRWKGRVDQTVNIRIAGEDVEDVVLSGRATTNVSHNMDGYLAQRDGRIAVRKIKGRGSVTILEQPSRMNNYTAVIQIFDPKSSDAEYDIEVTW